ncbi:caspase-6-like [Scleropages formosus]|uniref:Caspase-6 n=1 Tax=Scleropages formosus TaxID=113540 RepID=A0A8C9RT60_SCLFO|nr:caspase-6-like [Scleropages formosus]
MFLLQINVNKSVCLDWQSAGRLNWTVNQQVNLLPSDLIDPSGFRLIPLEVKHPQGYTFVRVRMDPSEEYKMNHKRRGVALIFNQKRFKEPLAERRGSDADRENLKERLEDLNFEVTPYNDLTKKEMVCKLERASKNSHEDDDCFVCVFLSHGEKDNIYAKDDMISIQDIMSFFKGDACRSLVGKPKIFIIQACRGEKFDNPVTAMCDDDDVLGGNAEQTVEEKAVLNTLPAGADFLMCYSVAEGYFSFRHIEHGSWYIQDLCEVLKQYGTSLEFTELLTLVNRKVSMRSTSNVNAKKQVPCFASMLTKKLYFRAKNE